jgi:stringent starvation protein B
MHEWMSDNGQTPLLIVDASGDGVLVPTESVDDDHVVLNVSWSATRNLQLGNELITFEARFSGTSHAVSVPVASIKGIYARESGQGMMFQDEPTGDSGTESSGTGNLSDSDSSKGKSGSKGSGNKTEGGKKPARPGLRVVK